MDALNVPAGRPGLPALAMSAPSITDVEISAVTEALRSGSLSLGPRLDTFERRVSEQVGVRHGIGVSSGTAGLHLAVVAAGVGQGDLVVTTPFSFVASSNCVLYEGAEPVFVDVDPVSGNIDPDLVKAAVHDLRCGGAGAARWLSRSARDRGSATGTVKAVLPVHAFGQPADMQPIADVAAEYGLTVIEDACEAVGARYRGRAAGTLGDVGVFAFYPNKQMTTGEGGMVLTDRDDWGARIRSMRNQGRDAMDAWLRHDRLGYNYRMDELSAALGLAQLSRLNDLLSGRDRVAACYSERLADMPGLVTPPIVRTTTRMSWFVYVVRLHPAVGRNAVMADLACQGIPTRAYFTPIHLQPFYAARFGYRRGDFPRAEALGDACLALPFYAALRAEDVDRVCRALSAAIGRHGGRGLENATQIA